MSVWQRGLFLGKYKGVVEITPENANNFERKPECIPGPDEELANDNFGGESHELLIDCGIVFVLPAEYDRLSEESEIDEDFVQDEVADEKPISYYVIGNGVFEEQNAIFEKPDHEMMYHLKPIFIRARVDGVMVNKVVVNGGAVLNLTPHSLLQKLINSDRDLRPHNMVLSNYEGKPSCILWVIQDLVVGSTTRPTISMVISSKENFNILLGREWIDGVGVVPSTLHQRVVIWRQYGIEENVEADQSYYKADITKVRWKHFD